jgi:hypothetical protein
LYFLLSKKAGLTGLVIKDDSPGRAAREWREMQPCSSLGTAERYAQEIADALGETQAQPASVASANSTRFFFSSFHA